MIDSTSVDLVAIADQATENLRTLWRSVSPELRPLVEMVASGLDAVEGDRQYLLACFPEPTLEETQQEYRDKILSY
jgi:hypothetical protein